MSFLLLNYEEMNSFVKSVLIVTALSFSSVIIIGLNTYENKEQDTDRFLIAVPQEVESRKIANELKSYRYVNISENHEIFRSNMLASTPDNITIFDRANFQFYQFDYNLDLINRFGSEGRGPGEFSSPVDLKSDDRYYWIADGRQNKVSKRDGDGTLVKDLVIDFSAIPHRFGVLNDEHYVLFSLLGTNAFNILKKDGTLQHSFLSVSGIPFVQRGFLMDGHIAVNNGVIYYAGIRNNMLKAFSASGEQIYSRNIIKPVELDLLNMSDQELRSSESVILDITIQGDKILLFHAGEADDENRWRYIDIYDKNTGDYLYTYILESVSRKIVTTNEPENYWVVLGHDNDTHGLSLFIYRSPL